MFLDGSMNRYRVLLIAYNVLDLFDTIVSPHSKIDSIFRGWLSHSLSIAWGYVSIVVYSFGSVNRGGQILSTCILSLECSGSLNNPTSSLHTYCPPLWWWGLVVSTYPPFQQVFCPPIRVVYPSKIQGLQPQRCRDSLGSFGFGDSLWNTFYIDQDHHPTGLPCL